MTWQSVIHDEARYSVECADCVTFLDAMSADSVDLVFGSPPYEQARLYLENGKDMGIAMDTEAWVAWMVKVYTACLRVCRGLVAFVVEGQTRKYRYSCGPALLMADLHRQGITLRKPPIFHRVGIPGSGGPDWLRNDWEWIICATRGGKLPWSDNTACGHPPKWAPGGAMSHRLSDGARVNQWGHSVESGATVVDEGGSVTCKGKRPSHKFMSMTSRGSNGERKIAGGRRVVRGSTNGDTTTEDAYLPPTLANPGNVLHHKVGGGLMGHVLAHSNEAPFPLDLAEFFVRSFAPPNGVVCDPFSGSGTSLHAALLHGRRFTGCDLRESQVDLSRRRAETITPNLFTG